ncbi:MAG: hypothetical protein OEN22_05850, partial [Gammaproteobacteria bacterium]|nr:hypothetical protein [Gammaproteobacteria bacterium]
EYLFEQIGLDTEVRIINEPVKMGWNGEQLVMEVHPVLETLISNASGPESPDSEDAVSEVAAENLAKDVTDEVPVRDPLTYVTERFIAATNVRAGELDWQLVEDMIGRSDGIPGIVGQSIKNAAASAASKQ